MLHAVGPDPTGCQQSDFKSPPPADLGEMMPDWDRRKAVELIADREVDLIPLVDAPIDLGGRERRPFKGGLRGTFLAFAVSFF